MIIFSVYQDNRLKKNGFSKLENNVGKIGSTSDFYNKENLNIK